MFNKLIKADTIRKAWAVYPRQSKVRIPVMFLLGLVQTALEAFGIGLVIPVMTTMSKATTGNSGSVLQPLFNFLGIRAVGTMVGVAVLCIVATYFVKNLYKLFFSYISSRVQNFTSHQVTSQLFRSYLTRPYTFHLQRNSSDLLNSMQQEAGMTIGLVGIIVGLVQELLLASAVIWLMVYTEPIAAISTVSILVAGSLLYLKVTKPLIIAFGQQRQKIQAPLTRYLLQGFAGVKDIKVLGRSNEFLSQYERQNRLVQDTNLRYGILRSIAPMWTLGDVRVNCGRLGDGVAKSPTRSNHSITGIICHRNMEIRTNCKYRGGSD
jgi:ABC-type multidrug transport system fused ATPase/permease subunit